MPSAIETHFFFTASILTTVKSIQRSAFAVLSRTFVAVYSRAPIFGFLRASVAVIRNGRMLLVIERSDGRGFSLPGGLAFPWETAQQAMMREVHEETGLQIRRSNLLFEYKTSADIRCMLSVFEAESGGDLIDSWEGIPRWLDPADFRSSLLPSQKEILDRIA